jgi:hypothetical protein
VSSAALSTGVVLASACSGRPKASSVVEFGIIAGCHDEFGASDIMLPLLYVAQNSEQVRRCAARKKKKTRQGRSRISSYSQSHQGPNLGQDTTAWERVALT